MKAPNRQKVTLHQKRTIFKSEEEIVIVTFSTVKDATVDPGDDVNKMIESFQFLN